MGESKKKMNIPQPKLAVRLLPFLDITFILLAFFMILPHGSFEKKTASIPKVEKLREESEQLEISSDIPVYLQILPNGKAKIKIQVFSWKWDFHNFDFSQARKKEAFLAKFEEMEKQFLQVLAQADKIRAKRERQMSSTIKKRGRPPKVFIQVEIHRYATIRLPLKFVSFLEKYTRQNPQFIFALRRVEQ